TRTPPPLTHTLSLHDALPISTDSGKSWTHAGLEDTGRIGRIVVHPSNPDIAFVCALGRTTGPQQERGVYRTTDRGQHWERVLFRSEEHTSELQSRSDLVCRLL